MKNRSVSLFLIAASMMAIIYGITQGESTQVMLKAIQICLECIGIG